MKYIITVYLQDHNVELGSAHDERMEKLERHLFTVLSTQVSGLKQLEVDVRPLLPPPPAKKEITSVSP